MQTNFAALTTQQKLVWSRDVWQAARDKAFINKFVGTDDNCVIQRVTELTKTEKGEQAIMHLVADLVGDGVIGDDEREGNEEELKSYSQIIGMDLITNSVRNKGKLADQKTVIKFREQGKDKLAYWLSNRIDQLAFLTMSGISYAYNNDGSSRVASPFANLAFNLSGWGAPTTKRGLQWTASSKSLGAIAHSSLVATDTPSYAMLVQAKAYATDHYVKPLMAGGKEYYVMFVKPGFMAKLKQAADYQAAIIQAADRGMTNPFFTGGTVTVDGIIIHEHRLVYSTLGLASGSKWGTSGTVEGSRALLCGAQALGMVDLGAPEWNEKEFQYGSSQGINVDKMLGFVKPSFYSIYDKSVEDFGVLAIDHAL
jgi:N4-gp56 family major capsid protein